MADDFRSVGRRGVAEARQKLHRSTLTHDGYQGDDRPVRWTAVCVCGLTFSGTYEQADKWATRHPEEKP